DGLDSKKQMESRSKRSVTIQGVTIDEIDQKVGQNSLAIKDGKIPMDSANQTAETESILIVTENDEFRGNSAIPNDSIENKVHCKAANTMKQTEVLPAQKQPNTSMSDQIKRTTVASVSNAEQVEDSLVKEQTAVKDDVASVSYNSEQSGMFTNNDQDEISLQSGSQGQHKRGLPAGCLFVARQAFDRMSNLKLEN
ncbi:1486_t:CDS:2, partial [Cetraspora pellucida]